MSETVPFFTAVAPADFTWSVKVPVPAEGRYVHATFDGRFRYLTKEQLDDLLKQNLTDRQLAEHVLLGIVQLQGETAPQLRTEPEIIRQVLDVDRAAAATFGTYVAAIRGLAAERNF